MSVITLSDVAEIVFWTIKYVLVPSGSVYGAWFALTRFPKKAPFILDLLRCCCFIFVVILVLLFSVSPTLIFWPPHWLERIHQRRIVRERVQEAGGLDAIRKDCEAIVQTHAATGFQWFYSFNTNDLSALPKSLAALQPRMVQLWPEQNGMQTIQIKIFGGHATGGRGQDFYILKVVCPPPPNFRSPFEVNPNAKVNYGNREVADGIYEATGKS